MSSFFDRLQDQQSVKFADTVGDFFKTLPRLPGGIVSFLVKIAPYVAVIGGLVQLILTPLWALRTILSLLTIDPLTGLLLLASTVLIMLNGLVLLKGYSPLLKRQAEGWMYLFWGEVFYTGSVILGILIGNGWVSSLLAVVIRFYLIYQLRSSYSPVAEVIAKTKKSV